jgi:large subunit ribosomal protein L27
MGRDHTLYATTHGTVKFEVSGAQNRRVVNVVPAA